MVIIGAGECGARAAFALRERGWTGEIVLVGGERHLPYERPPLSKEAITGDDAPAPKLIAQSERVEESKIDLQLGVRVTEIDPTEHVVALDDGRSIQYERLLLATGSVPRRLPTAPDAFALRTFDDAIRIHSSLVAGTRLVIVGAGFIGLELAASARSRGCKVTVIEKQPRVMARAVPAEVAETMSARHTAEGVDIRCGTAITVIHHGPRGWALALDSGDVVAGDVLVAGIGVVPETTLAKRAGLEIDNGVRVDARLVTSDPDIMAAGDCCSFPHPIYGNRRIRLESWRNAQDQGAHAAGTMLGSSDPFSVVPWFWSDQYDLGLQIAGLPSADDTEVRRSRDDGADVRFGLAEDGRLLWAAGVGVGSAVARDIRVAEKLIERRATPDPQALADGTKQLKQLLKR